MNLYHWNRSEALRRYAQGDIIVMALSLEQARQFALEKFIEWIDTPDTYFNYLKYGIDLETEEEDSHKLLERFKSDLNQEPLVQKNVGALFLMGSE